MAARADVVEHAVAGHDAGERGAARDLLPQPQQLAALGAVVCLYPVEAGGELGGWTQAVRAEIGSDLDSDGLREHLLFYDRDDRCCWQLHLLPDSDFLAWERLAARLPVCAAAPRAERIGARLWSRLAHRLRGERWRASALRLHALHGGPGFGAFAPPPGLAASVASLSMLGAAAARRIARLEGADGEAFVEDCCCRQAALAAMRAASAAAARDEDTYSSIRFQLTRSKPRASA